MIGLGLLLAHLMLLHQPDRYTYTGSAGDAKNNQIEYAEAYKFMSGWYCLQKLTEPDSPPVCSRNILIEEEPPEKAKKEEK